MEQQSAGRPEYKKTNEDAKNVEALTIAGVPQKLIAEILKMPYKILKSKKGNRLYSSLKSGKTRELGWKPTKCLQDYLLEEIQN